MASWSDRLAQVTQNAISKSKEVAGVTKLNMEISALNQDIRNIQAQVGAYVLENGFLLENPYVADWAEKVHAHKANIEAKNEKIMELKNVTICPGCGKEVSRSNRFCEHCGAEVVIKTPAADEAAAEAAEAAAENGGETSAFAESVIPAEPAVTGEDAGNADPAADTAEQV